MIVTLLSEHDLEFPTLKGGRRGSSESTLVKMLNCWKSHAASLIFHCSSMRPSEIFALLFLGATYSTIAQQDEAAQAYLDTYSSQLEALYYRSSLASWAYYTNLTSENQKVMVSSGLHITRIILFSQPKHMMWALQRTVSMSIQNTHV